MLSLDVLEEMFYPRAIVLRIAASILEPLRENGRPSNISSASSSLLRSLPSDLTQRRRFWSSAAEYSPMDSRTGIGAVGELLLPVGTAGTNGGGAASGVGSFCDTLSLTRLVFSTAAWNALTARSISS